MQYLRPNFDIEWEEAIRYPEFEKMGKDNWIEYAKKNFEIGVYNSIKDKLNNVDLDYDNLEPKKKKRFEKSFKEKTIEIPLVVKFSDDDYDLIGGNTRLSGLVKHGKNPKLWVIDMENIKENKNPYEEDDDKDDVFPSGSSDWRKKKQNDELWVRDEDPIDNDLEEPEDDDDKKPKPKPKKDVKETGADASGGFEAPLFSTVKRKINEEGGIGGSGSYDVPAFGKTSRGGRRNPLKIDGPDSIYKGRAVKDKNFPKWGGPDSVFVKIKEKCKKFPYCNQGDTGALEFIHEDEDLKRAIEEACKLYNLRYEDVEKVVINEIKKIFI